MTKGDWKAFKTLYSNPFAEVCCSQCGSRLLYKVSTKSEALGNIYYIECSGTPRCWFYPIPPTVTPECIRWHHPVEIKAGTATADYNCSACCVADRCTVDKKE